MDATITSPRSGGGAPASKPGSQPASAAGSQHASAAGSSVERHGSIAASAIFGTAPPVDLMHEHLLQGAPRVEYHGHTCPSLGGIPLLRKLGQGGMGAVYCGVHPRLHVEVAVKVLPYHLQEKDPLLIERFFREAQISAAVRSPHLVNVMDVNDEHGVFFLVMEYVNGKSAKDYLEKVLESGKQGMSERDALLICVAAAEGLKDAHSQGIVHRDVKPDNIMIGYRPHTQDLELSAAKLMDLGLARADSGVIGNAALTQTKQAMGTPGFMAPEQIMDARSAGPPADIFAMGATLYALLAGQAPFKQKNQMQTLMATLQSPHQPLIQVRPDISPGLSAVLDKCLAKEKGDRYADGGQLLAELQKCLRAIGGKGETFVGVQAGRPSSQAAASPAPDGAGAPAGAARRPKRGLLLVGAGSAAAVALLVVGAIVLRGRAAAPSNDAVDSYKKALETARKSLVYEVELAKENFTQARALREKFKISDPENLKREEAVASLIKAYDAKEAQKSPEEIEEHVKAALSVFPYSKESDPKKDPVVKICQLLVQERVKTVKAVLDQQDGDLATAEKNYKAAAEIIPDHLELAALRDTLVQRRLARVQGSLGKYAFDDADKNLKALEKLDPKNKQLDDLWQRLDNERYARKRFDDQIRDAKGKLASDADIELVEETVAKATKGYPSDPEIKPLREAVARKRLDAAEKYLAKEDWNEVEKSLKAAEAQAPGESRIAQIRERLAKAKTKFDQFRALATEIDAGFNKKDTSLLDGIEKKITEAEKLSPDDPNIKSWRGLVEKARAGVALETELKKQDDFRKELSQADDLIAQEKFRDAAERIAAAEKIIPGDPRTKSKRDRLAERQAIAEQKAAEKGRRDKFLAGLKQVDAILTAAKADAKDVKKLADAESKLADAEKRLADADKDYPNDEATSQRRDEFGKAKEMVKHGKFESLLAAADKALQAKETNLADAEKNAGEAGKLLKDAEALYPNDAKLPPLREKAATKQKAIAEEKAKRGKFETFVKKAGELLQAQQADLAAAGKNIEDAAALYPNDPEIKPLRDRLTARKAETDKALAEKLKRDKFEGLVKEIETGLAVQNADLAAAEKKLLSAAEMYRDDPKLKPLRDQLDKKKADGLAAKAAAETAERKKQLDEKAKSIGALLAAGDLAKAGASLGEAEKAFPNDPGLAQLRQQLTQLDERKNKRAQFDAAAAAAETALARGELPKAEAAIGDAARLLPDDPALAPLRQKLDTAKKAKAAEDAKKKKESDDPTEEGPGKRRTGATTTPPPPPPTGGGKRRRIGEEDVE